MKALVYTGPEKLDFIEVSYPTLREDEVLVKIDSVGICGSDMHAFLGHDDRRPAPLILGHEVAGTIVGGAEDGRRVTVNPLVTCGTCPACMSGRDNLCPDRQIISMQPREGGFAEFVAIPLSNVVTVPDDYSLEKACMAEPIACGWHAVRLAQKVLDIEIHAARALVIGGGAIGVGAALSLFGFGATDVTVLEPNEIRRGYLKKTTDLNVLDPADLDNDAQFDLVIDGVGFAATRETASNAVRPGGVIMHIGLGGAEGGLDIRRVTLQEIIFGGTYTYTAADFRATAQAMFDGKLGPLEWYETRNLPDGANAFTDIRQGIVEAPKIILKP
ncbi:galactitol-1-phosphate 5-dehydrogenase [Rhodobacterales bacterium 52_120_T64]|nr:galactitol-1-phosphate 5-dehydrogenase [Rhodobacterales bacterium 52_120_T64]